jgi:hypothetical protein
MVWVFAFATSHLWRKVLLLAIEDCSSRSSVGKPHNKRNVQQTARAWIFSKSDDPGSFNWCCEMLGIDPRALHRQALLRTPTYRHPSNKDVKYAVPNSQTTD